MGERVLISIRPACSLGGTIELATGDAGHSPGEVRGSGEIGLRFEIGDPLAQSRESALQRL